MQPAPTDIVKTGAIRVYLDGVQAGNQVRRRRRAPQEAQAEIIGAAEALLRERPFRELTVDEVMRRTGLSRPSFYVYFRDRNDLVLRVVEHFATELFLMSDRWYKGTGDGRAQLREAIQGVADVYVEHGAVLNALAEAAAEDPTVEAAYSEAMNRFIDATTDHIEREMQAGKITALNARETAVALTWLNERYLRSSLGREPREDPGMVVETLSTIWQRTLYGT